MYQFILTCIEQHPVSSHFKFNRGKFTTAKVRLTIQTYLILVHHLNEIILSKLLFTVIPLPTPPYIYIYIYMSNLQKKKTQNI